MIRPLSPFDSYRTLFGPSRAIFFVAARVTAHTVRRRHPIGTGTAASRSSWLLAAGAAASCGRLAKLFGRLWHVPALSSRSHRRWSCYKESVYYIRMTKKLFKIAVLPIIGHRPRGPANSAAAQLPNHRPGPENQDAMILWAG